MGLKGGGGNGGWGGGTRECQARYVTGGRLSQIRLSFGSGGFVIGDGWLVPRGEWFFRLFRWDGLCGVDATDPAGLTNGPRGGAVEEPWMSR